MVTSWSSSGMVTMGRQPSMLPSQIVSVANCGVTLRDTWESLGLLSMRWRNCRGGPERVLLIVSTRVLQVLAVNPITATSFPGVTVGGCIALPKSLIPNRPPACLRPRFRCRRSLPLPGPPSLP